MMKSFRILVCTLLSGAVFTAGGVSAMAGERNVVIIEQSGSGNSLVVEQSEATDSQVGGIVRIDAPAAIPETTFKRLSPSSLDFQNNPALQSGANNQADIEITGTNGSVYLLQNNSSVTGSQIGNTASINLSGQEALAAVSQIGDQNNANVSVTGALSSGSVLQNGDNNTGTLGVQSSDTAASLVQNGSNNSTELQVTGISNGTVTYTLNANNSSAAGPVVVNTNGASVTITQTQ